ncbi:hypothetical protein ElyMa_004872700 [Elysia marginata]|uniref:Uncharacterized protein n=1 Tax=Elysia marginata TaxID=1093978 RepID=A0AAV4IRH0_9GAST|nr:hypothetical protein ElyMa_004872700 [Elysia marginata]
MADREMAFGFYETSAKTGENIYKAFHDLAFHITDINHPRLMKSYHPHSIRPISQHDPALNQDANLRQFKTKPKFRIMKGKTSQTRDIRGQKVRSFPPSSASPSKRSNSTEPRARSSLSYPPWETFNGGSPAINSSVVATKPNTKTKTRKKDKKKRGATKDGSTRAKSTSGVLRRTFGCLLCRNVCFPRKSKKKRQYVI